MTQPRPAQRVGLARIARGWARIGVTGFGGPPAHIRLLHELVVERERWLDEREFEDAIAACNLLPGPASTQLAIYVAWRLNGPVGALVGGLAFILPAVLAVLALSALFLARSPPAWVRGAGAGAGAAVAAVAVQAALRLMPSSWRRASSTSARSLRWSAAPSSALSRWIAYLIAGGLASALLGPYLVLVLIACGALELAITAGAPAGLRSYAAPLLIPAIAGFGGIGALAWVAFKVGALSYGGGFVIVPLMQHDAVSTYHWMSATRFLNAVALGQVTPGPVVATVAAVGYAARGVGGGALAAAIAFAPSFAFVLLGARWFERLRADRRAQAFLTGAGPAAIGAILGAAIPLAEALRETWQWVVLGVAALALLGLRRGVVLTLIGAGVTGAVIGIAGGPLP